MNFRKLVFVVGIALSFCLLLTSCNTEGGEKIVTILKLPDTPEFSNQNKHFDIGIIYKQDKLLGILTWNNYNERWCITYGDKTYAGVVKEALDQIAKSAGLEMPDKMKLPLVDRISEYLLTGLGIIILALIILFSIKEKL